MRITKEIHWPEIGQQEIGKNLPRAIGYILNFLDRLRRTLDQRDKKIAQAINMADIQVVTSIPSTAPEYGEPAIVIYYSGATYRLYVYIDGDWRYVALI